MDFATASQRLRAFFQTGATRSVAFRRGQLERLTGALLDRLTHHVHILSLNGESYRLAQSAGRRRGARAAEPAADHDVAIDPETGEITST